MKKEITMEDFSLMSATGVHRHTIHFHSGASHGCHLYNIKDGYVFFWKELPKTEDELKQGDAQVPYGFAPVTSVNYISINWD